MTTDLVVVDAQAVNKKTGRTVGGLSREDFALYEDDVKQFVTHFSQDRLPLSVVLLLDVSVLPAFSRMPEIRLIAFPQLKPEDEIALMAFDAYAKVIQPLTQDKQLVAAKIKNPGEIISALRGTGPAQVCEKHIGDSVYQAALYLLNSANPFGRRTIIVVTDNEPFETKVAHSKQEVINQLFETGAVVYGLTLPPGYEDYLIPKIAGRLPMSWLLRKLYNKGGTVDPYADSTGGVVFKSGREAVEEKLAALISLLRSRYSFGDVSSNQKRDGKFRKIQLKVSPLVERREGRLDIVTRRGYTPKPKTVDRYEPSIPH